MRYGIRKTTRYRKSLKKMLKQRYTVNSTIDGFNKILYNIFDKAPEGDFHDKP